MKPSKMRVGMHVVVNPHIYRLLDREKYRSSKGQWPPEGRAMTITRIEKFCDDLWLIYCGDECFQMDENGEHFTGLAGVVLLRA